MDLQLQDQHVLVTGGSKGIGLACALGFLREGARVSLVSRDLANLERTIEQLKANQQQITSDNAKAIGELKANQDDMKRALAKVSEQSPPKASPPATRPAPTFCMPERSRPQARARPRYPREWMYDDYDW